MSSSIDFSAGQLAAARAVAWHQDGKGLQTLEGARNWVDHFGLVLFAPRAAQLGAPAPSFIEATLGEANPAPTAAESATARSLATRLVAEGSAVPLNLLGVPKATADQPDFLASAKVFSYVFTMRGDKTWKQPPSSTDGAKVSPLAVRVWEVLGEKGALTAAELVSELGREVTETAITRALNELWSQLRVIPQHQADDTPARWDLTSKRFAKAIKAGTNAGQPTAMSALMSLYLSQAVGATEEEIAGFLSPLTARSRVREVLHALIAGRQLDATVVDGKTLLHVSGTLPEFAEISRPAAEEGTEPAAEPAKKVGTGRIARFTPGADSKSRTDFKGKPAFSTARRETSAGPRPAGPRGGRPGGGPRPSRPVGSPDEVARRPFKRSDAAPSFTKPWEEEKRVRPEPAEGDAPRPRRPYGDKPAYSPKEFGERKSFERKGSKPSFAGDRKPYGERTYGGSNSTPRKAFGDKPSYGAKSAFGDRKPYERKSFGDKPAYGAVKTYGDRPSRPRAEGASEGFTPRERPSYQSRDGERKPYERKSFGDKPAYGAKKPYGDRAQRPRPEGASEGFKPRSYERKPFAPRPGGDDRPRRTFDKPRTFGDKPAFGDRKPYEGKSFGDKPAYGAKKTYGDRPSFGPRPARPRPDGDSRAPRSGGFGSKPYGSKPAFGSKPSFGSKPAFGAKSRFSAGKPAGKFGGKPSFGDRPKRPYTKRADSAPAARRKPEPEV